MYSENPTMQDKIFSLIFSLSCDQGNKTYLRTIGARQLINGALELLISVNSRGAVSKDMWGSELMNAFKAVRDPGETAEQVRLYCI